MRIADITPGRTYRYKDRAGGVAYGVCVVLDTRWWVRAMGGTVPHDAEKHGRIGPQSGCIAVADLAPLVTLGDGSEHVSDFGWWLNVGAEKLGWGSGGRVEPRQMHVRATPKLLSPRAIACSVPLSWITIEGQ